MILLDTSVAVPAALPEHVDHRGARAALPRGKTRAIAQVATETYSVLTRLPPAQRVRADVATAYLHETFEFPPLCLDAEMYANVFELAAANGITGGAVYDAIVGATAVGAGGMLLTRDRRAVPTYRAVGAGYRLLD